MLRFILNAMTVASMLVLAALIALWVRSFNIGDFVAYNAKTGGLDVISSRGRVQVRFQDEPFLFFDNPDQFGFARWRMVPIDLSIVDAAKDRDWWGFYFFNGIHPAGSTVRVRTVRVPHWVLCFAAAALPTFRLGRWRQVRSHRIRLGLCLRCGYDLRASVGPCPECGLARG